MSTTPDHRTISSKLDCMFRPERASIIGPSPEVGTPRNSIVHVLQQTGYPGSLYLMSPRRDAIEGLKCYRNAGEKGALFRKLAQEKRLPSVLSYSGEEPTPEEREAFRDDDIVFSRDPVATMRTLGWLYQRQRYSAREPAIRGPARPERPAPADWAGFMGLLNRCAIATPNWRSLQPGDQAATARDGLRDPVVVKALPVDVALVRSALQGLKLWTLLQGYLGQPKANIDALLKAALRFGDAFLAMINACEFEINPLLVLPEGQGAVAVDALIAERSND